LFEAFRGDGEEDGDECEERGSEERGPHQAGGGGHGCGGDPHDCGGPVGGELVDVARVVEQVGAAGQDVEEQTPGERSENGDSGVEQDRLAPCLGGGRAERVGEVRGGPGNEGDSGEQHKVGAVQ
jgi:hypothetical protein